jgi:hypothetical protein
MVVAQTILVAPIVMALTRQAIEMPTVRTWGAADVAWRRPADARTPAGLGRALRAADGADRRLRARDFKSAR